MSGNLKIINKLFHRLSDTDSEFSDPEFLDRLFSITYFPFGLLKIEGPDIPKPLLEILLRFYDTREELFICNNIRFSITLEDILYITGLPIVGTPIAKYPKKLDSFKDVFNLDVKGGNCSISSLTSIALDKQLEDDVRIKAVLLILMTCFVVPTRYGHEIKADYVRYVDDLNEVGGYAWGAALLAFLKNGIREGIIPWKKSYVDGNLWVVLAFFLVRIKGLEELIGIEVNHDSTVPLILKCVEAVGKISQNHKLSYVDVKVYLENLTEMDVRWTPYVDLLSQLPENLKSQEKYGLLLAPICFMNCLVYHKPHLTPKQFPRLKGVHLEKLTWKEAPLKFRKIRERLAQNFLEIYKKELQDWCDRKLVTDFLPLSEGRDCVSEDGEEEDICFRKAYEKVIYSDGVEEMMNLSNQREPADCVSPDQAQNAKAKKARNSSSVHADNDMDANGHAGKKHKGIPFNHTTPSASPISSKDLHVPGDDHLVNINGYKIKSTSAETLEAIFTKYGDIMTHCLCKSKIVRASLLHVICNIAHRLQYHDVDVILSELEDIENGVSDLEANGIKVSWLHEHLAKLRRIVGFKEGSFELRKTKAKSSIVTKAVDKELKQRHAELVLAQERFQEAEKRVNAMRLVGWKIDDDITEFESEEYFWKRRLDDLAAPAALFLGDSF